MVSSPAHLNHASVADVSLAERQAAGGNYSTGSLAYVQGMVVST
jgi:hypothetical protein